MAISLYRLLGLKIMLEGLGTPVLITLVGMGLVILAILILWLAIIILVAIFDRLARKSESSEEAASNYDLRRRAAIAAVVVALNRESEEGLHEFPLPPTAFVSAWQAVMRSNIIKRRGQIR
jgi:Na+-transporting methylmalonyl-CoA/oxaloacetate decarboxylase gamma subunit